MDGCRESLKKTDQDGKRFSNLKLELRNKNAQTYWCDLDKKR